ncbi:hypothetical protein [Nocardioides bruguierae]|uniref:FtsX-like permease family protein n=1 Tax=Nocardioides bruguierae TaxID=2945102 RepID=A0A9X2IGM1_9ACTN|nr:hypothetical protein [Nocardioides bruguierae]MCM0620920.1 hypothetical protein [Nocardioides bruguierae]
MTRTLRGAWSRRGTLLPLLGLTVVVVAGVVSVLGVAGATGTSRALALPLLVLGAVALPTTGRELAVARRGEIALARLRGHEGAPLVALLSAEPLLVLLLGGALGVVAGLGVALVAVPAWTSEPASVVLTARVLVGALVAAVVVLLAGLVAVGVGMVSALREPLADQVGGRPRHAAAGAAAAFGQVLVVVAGALACYRAVVAGQDGTGSGSGTGEPDLVVLAGPALVGLAVGGLVLVLLRAGARALVRRRDAGLAGYVATRRLARTADAAAAVRVLVAAAVVAGLAVSAASDVDAWVEDTARLEAGGPVVVRASDDVDLDAAALLALTRRLDPAGTSLLPVVTVPGTGSAPARRVYWDSARAGAVLGDFYDSTPAAGVADLGDVLGGSESTTLVQGTRLTATVSGVSARSRGRVRPEVVVELARPDGRGLTVMLAGRLPRSGEPLTLTRRVACTDGCTLTSVTLARPDGTSTLPWLLRDLRVTAPGAADEDEQAGDLLATRLGASTTGITFERGGVLRRPDHVEEGEVHAPPTVTSDGLLATATRDPLTAVPLTAEGAVPVVATDTALASTSGLTSTQVEDGETFGDDPVAESPGGDDLDAVVVASAPALPLVGADGLLMDLPRALEGASPTVPLAQLSVVAAAGTSDDLLTQVADALGAQPRTLADVRADVEAGTGAVQARVYLLIAAFCLLAAVLVLTTAVVRERRGWVRDVAALRVAGVPIATLRDSVRREVAGLLVLGAAGAALGTALSAALLLPSLGLVRVPDHGLALEPGVTTGPLVVLAAVVAVVVVAVVGRGRSVGAVSTRPGLLREEAR